MPTLLTVSHVTRYSFDRLVSFGRHRLMVRPRDAHDLRVLEAHLLITPSADLLWKFDTFGNSIAEAAFSDPSDHLEVCSTLLIKRYTGMSGTAIEHRSLRMPISYDSEEATDLAPFIAMEFPKEREALGRWLASVFCNRPDQVYPFLKAMSAAIYGSLVYGRREDKGTYSAMTAVGHGTGTCRDFAFLFMECARFFGFASRFVTGYLHVQEYEEAPLTGGGSTHAWADVYVPGEGWLEFDPTNQIDNNKALIRIAVTRTPRQAAPISGTYKRGDAKYLGMSVSVSVSEVNDEEAGVLRVSYP